MTHFGHARHRWHRDRSSSHRHSVCSHVSQLTTTIPTHLPRQKKDNTSHDHAWPHGTLTNHGYPKYTDVVTSFTAHFATHGIFSSYLHPTQPHQDIIISVMIMLTVIMSSAIPDRDADTFLVDIFLAVKQPCTPTSPGHTSHGHISYGHASAMVPLVDTIKKQRVLKLTLFTAIPHTTHGI